MANRELMIKIETVFEESDETYGSPRVYRALKSQGVTCSENRVARLMRLRGLRAKQVRRFRATTKRNRAHRPAPNRLERDFAAERPDQKWLADITYIPTLEGWLYLAVILDLFSRRIVGWAMSERMTSDLTLRALRMAIRRRQPDPGLIHHSDRAPVCSFVFSGGDSVPCGGGNCSASYPKVERLMGTKRDVRKKGSEGSIKPSSSLRASSTRRKLDSVDPNLDR
jgi:transposase InsO family protein